MAKRDLPKVETRLYINGKWQTGTEGTFEVINPATGETLANVQKVEKVKHMKQSKPLRKHLKSGQKLLLLNGQN